VPVGCSKPPPHAEQDVADLLPRGRTIVGIFENLHWHRYDAAYREAFVAGARALAEAFPQVLFVLKPHHAGLWLTSQYEGQPPAAANLLVADPQSPAWERHTAGALLGHLSAVITTPSTVALDAARAGLPVAVAAHGLDLDNYRPLERLAEPADWQAFVRGALAPGQRPALQERSARFVERVLVPGDAARRIVEDLRAAVAVRAGSGGHA